MKIKFIANIKGIYLGYSFEPSEVVTIGREIGNTIAPINVDGFSRHHARIFFKDGAWYVEDVGSTNGTYRNRVKVEAPTKIEKGDSIRCGLMELASFNFEESSSPAPVTAAEPPKPVVPPAPAEPVKPASAIEPLAELEPVAEVAPVTPLEPITPLEPVEEIKPDSPTKTAKVPSPVVSPALRRPTIPGLNPGLKPGLKLPQKGGALPTGLKLPPKGGALPAGLKLPPKPGLKPGLKVPGKGA